MKDTIIHALQSALDQLITQGLVPHDHGVTVQVTRTRERAHGDFASNLALQLARPAKSSPRSIAGRLQALLQNLPDIQQVDIAGPGFLNFHLTTSARFGVLAAIERQCSDFGRSTLGQGQSVQVEFVSANPTGPLHVGHGRGAAYGSTLADLLAFCGYSVTREYYLNDAGRQMNILAVSVWLRYLEEMGVQLTFPSNGYKGDYLRAIARRLALEMHDSACHTASEILTGLPPDEPEGGDRETHIDALVERCRQLLGTEQYAQFFAAALGSIRQDIEEDLAEFGDRKSVV